MYTQHKTLGPITLLLSRSHLHACGWGGGGGLINTVSENPSLNPPASGVDPGFSKRGGGGG